MSTPFTPGELTGPQARALNELARITEQFSRLTVAPPLSLTRPAGIPAIRMESASTSAFIGAAAKGTTTQSIANNTPTNISWDDTEFDTSSFWSGGDPTKLTVPEDGYYHVGCSNYWQSGPTNYSAQILLSHSASITFAFQGGIVPSDLVQSAQTVTGIIHASAGDYFVVTVTQLSGVNKNAKSYTTQYSRFWCYKIG